LASTNWASRLDSLARSRLALTGEGAGAAGAALIGAPGMAANLARSPFKRFWLIFLLVWTSARLLSSSDRRLAVPAKRSGTTMPPFDSVNWLRVVSLVLSASATWPVCWVRYSRVLLASSMLKVRVRVTSTST
jgi:hypothetical protein